MRSGFSHTRIAYARLPRFLGRPIPWMRLSTGITFALAKLKRNAWSAPGSVLKTFTYIRRLGTTWLTRMPSRCTRGGSRLITMFTRFWTLTTLMSGSVPGSK